MTTEITHEFIKRLADKNNRDIDVDRFLHYLVVIGLCFTGDKSDVLVAEESTVRRIEDMLSPITVGNIVLVFNDGMYVVIDLGTKHSDGKHFRGMKVSMDNQGAWRIDTAVRSNIFEMRNTLHFATSKFDVKALNEYSYDRYIAYIKIAQLNEQLGALRG